MSKVRRIAFNSGYLIVGNVVSKLISFFFLLIVARYLGVEGFGQLSFALSFAALFAILTHMGVRIRLKREISRAREAAGKLISQGVGMQLLLGILTLIVIAVTSWISGWRGETFLSIMLAAIFVVLQSLMDFFEYVFQAFETMQYAMFLKVGRSLLRLLLTVAVIALGGGFVAVLATYGIAAGLMCLIAGYLVYTKAHPFRLSFSWTESRMLILASLPFAIAGAARLIYDKMDITLLKLMAPLQVSGVYSATSVDAVVGWYSAAYQLLESTTFLPIALTASLAPLAARAYLSNKRQLQKIYHNSFKFLFMLSLPLVVGGFVLAGPIVELIFGAGFLDAATALRWLIGMLLFNFQVYTFGIILIAMNKERISMYAALIAVTANLVGNLVLIPRYGFVGAAVTTLLSEAIFFGISLIACSILIGGLKLHAYAHKVILASILMAIGVYLMRHLAVWLSIPLGATIYIVALLVLKTLSAEDWGVLIRVLRKDNHSRSVE